MRTKRAMMSSLSVLVKLRSEDEGLEALACVNEERKKQARSETVHRLSRCIRS